MRFSLFVHMERWDEEVSHRQLFEDLTELTLMAEAGGFSTVWIGEHHAMEYTISPSPMPLLAYLAGQTSTIRLGAGTIIAPFWNPIRVAGECALLDVISNGRMEVGLARGAYQFEFDRMAGGIPATERWHALREMVPGGARPVAGRLRPRRRDLEVPHVHQRAQADPAADPTDVDRRPRPRLARLRRKSGCNVMVTPLMKGDEEVLDLKNNSRPPWPTTPTCRARN